MRILIALLLMFVSTDVYGGSDIKSDANKKPYTFVKESQLNKEARKFVGLHERDTNRIVGANATSYDMECLELLEVAIQQSYEGCLMTAKLEPIIDPEKDREEQIRKHNKQKQ